MTLYDENNIPQTFHGQPVFVSGGGGGGGGGNGGGFAYVTYDSTRLDARKRLRSFEEQERLFMERYTTLDKQEATEMIDRFYIQYPHLKPNTESTEMTDYINHTKQSISRDKLIAERQELERVTAVEQTDSWSEWFAQGHDENGFCLYFEKVMENKTYRFCIMLSDGLWYMTGSRGLSGVGVDELIPRLVGLGIETNDVEVHTFGEVHSKAEELRNLTKKKGK